MFWKRWTFGEALIGREVEESGEQGKCIPKGESSMKSSDTTRILTRMMFVEV